MNLFDFIEQNWFEISILGAVIGFTWKTSNKITTFEINSKNENKELKENIADVKNELKDDISVLKSKIDEQECKRIEGHERTKIIMDGVEATLYTLHDQGANGPVTKSLEAIREYKSRKACL